MYEIHDNCIVYNYSKINRKFTNSCIRCTTTYTAIFAFGRGFPFLNFLNKIQMEALFISSNILSPMGSYMEL